MMMRTFVIAPAQMHAHAIRRNARERMVEHLDMELDRLAEVREGQILELDVATHREVGTVDLHNESSLVNRVILDAHRVAKRTDISLVALVVIVVEEERGNSGRRRAVERFLCLDALVGRHQLLDLPGPLIPCPRTCPASASR